MIDEKKLINNLTIRREKLRYISIVALHNNMNYVDTIINEINSIIDIINEQPKVGEWIPCSERLPEEDGIYIVDDRVFNSPWIHTAGFMVSSKAWCENHGVYYDDKYGRYEDGRVIAWQPLPEPWGGEE